MTQIDPEYGIILVTAGSEEQAKAIASTLIAEHLAACVSITPIHSVYRWEGEVQSEAEWQLMIKSNLHLFETISERIVSLHSYEVPEIIAIPIIKGFSPYLEWIKDNIKYNYKYSE
jgi:periplasmic divalent cation tolerance protein